MKSVRVLIAEDDFLVGKEIRRALAQIGHEVVALVANGQEAVEQTCSLEPNVVVMDIQMPKLDGLSASKQIQDCCPTPVVVLTAHESQEFVARASEMGVGAYLTKPPKPKEMERAISIAIARHADFMAYRQLSKKLEQQNEALERALSEIKTLRGILPICAQCKKIRDKAGSWSPLEVFIDAHSEAQFSHGLCPDCARKLYPEYTED